MAYCETSTGTLLYKIDYFFGKKENAVNKVLGLLLS